MASTHHTLDTIDLPRGMVWVDEFGTWTKQERAHAPSLTGKLLVDVGTRQEGRPITLSATEDSGWIKRSVLDSLRTLSEAAEATHALTLADGRTYTVRFADGDAAVTATPVARPELPGNDTPYVATLRLVEVTE